MYFTPSDINECRVAALESMIICTAVNTQCVNTEGSFECICVPGYELNMNGECQRKSLGFNWKSNTYCC